MFVTAGDTTPPVITLNGASEVVLECRVHTYVELGAWATDDCDPNPRLVIGGDTVHSRVCGTYIVRYVATDASGNSALATRTVIVRDTIAPTIQRIQVTPSILWPPNHKMVAVRTVVEASDICDPHPQITLVAVVSSEPDDAVGDGDGSTVNDIQNALVGTGDYFLSLRAERQANGRGRVYTLTYVATDNSGNGSTASTTVTVPRDQR